MNEKGFTLVEMIVAVVILAVGILALSASTTDLARISLEAQRNALALQACEDRIERVRLHPIYQQLDSLYTESGIGILGLDGFSRSTEVTRVIQDGEREGKYIDFTRVTVTVSGPGLDAPISRSVTVGGF